MKFIVYFFHIYYNYYWEIYKKLYVEVNNEKMKLLLVLLVFLCSIAVVSAEDTNATDVIQLAEDTSSDQETNIILQTDDEINDDANQEDILGAPTGTFFELQTIIDSVHEGDWVLISKSFHFFYAHFC